MSDFVYLWKRGRPRQRVLVSGLSLTLAINSPGQLTALIAAKDLYRLGFGSSLLGLCVRSEHPRLGAWEGEIQDEQANAAARTVDFVATSPAGTLAARRLPSTYLPLMASAPALIKAAIAASGAKRHLRLTDIRTTDFGRPIIGESRSDDLLSYVQQIAGATGCEWIDGVNEDGTWYMQIGPSVGSDKRHKVHLIVGVNCVDATEPGSLRTVVNDLLAIGDDRPYAAAAKLVTVEESSLTQPWGRREGTVRYTGITSEAGLEPLASADVARLGVPPIGPSLRMSAMHALAGEIRLGDTIRLSSGTANREYAFRSTTTTVSDNGKILTLTGSAAVIEEVGGPYGVLGSFILGSSLLS